MLQQYAKTVSWNRYVRNTALDADGLVTLSEYTGSSFPVEAGVWQNNCILSIISGPLQGLYYNTGSVAVPFWTLMPISPVLTDTFHITSAEILNLFSTPVPLVPAPGAGKYIIVDKIIFKYNRGTISYTGAGNTNVTMGANPSVQFGTILGLGSSVITQSGPSSVTLTEDTGLSLTHTIAPLVNGNGTADITVVYQISSL